MNNAGADTFDPIPKTAAQVARRSLVLSAAVCRGSLESGAADPNAEAVHQRVLNWLTALDLWEEAAPSEEAMLRAPLGTLETSVVLQSGWYAEGLAVLAWALYLLAFPKHDEQVDSYAVTDAFWFLDSTAQELLADAELRSPNELEACRELLYTIHARLRQYARHRISNNFTLWIERSWLDTLSCSITDLIAQDDFSVDGKPLEQVAEERLQELMSITSERHRAIIWLMGEQPNYLEITVDT